MFCYKCGKKNRDSADFCQRCGAPLAGHGGPRSRSPWQWVGVTGLTVVLLAATALILLRILRPLPRIAPVSTTESPPSTASAPTPAANSAIPVQTPLSPTSTFTPAPELGTSNLYVEYILDASNSMNDPLPDGTVKRVVADKLLAEHLRAFRPETNIGLRAFGHRVGGPKAASCTDIEQVAPVEKGQVERIVSWLGRVQPRGWTPLAETIQQAAEDFVFDPARINAVVLLSDGQETCGGDPCKLVEELKAQGVNFTIHVIGLNVDEPTRQQLTCIADAAGGTYHDAGSASDLETALGSVQRAVSQSYEIAFFSDRDSPGYGEIYVINSDGSAQTRLTSNLRVRPAQVNAEPDVVSLRWSGADRRFFFNINSNGLLHSVNVDGSGMSLLAERIYGFDLSPDAQHIVASRVDATLGVNIVTMSADGKDASMLIDEADRASTGLGPEARLHGPAWSPDGTRIAFYTEKGVYIVHVDGSPPLTYHTGGRRITGGYMDWSPDNQYLAFHLESPSSIGILDVTTGKTIEIPLNNDNGWAWSPSWSPDSSRIVFQWTIERQDANRESDIWLINTDGSGLTRLTFEGKNCCPVWLP